MKLFNKKSIKEINAEKKQVKTKEGAVESFATQLATEKIKGMQKDATIKQLSKEISNLKIDVMKIKGGMA